MTWHVRRPVHQVLAAGGANGVSQSGNWRLQGWATRVVLLFDSDATQNKGRITATVTPARLCRLRSQYQQLHSLKPSSYSVQRTTLGPLEDALTLN